MLALLDSILIFQNSKLNSAFDLQRCIQFYAEYFLDREVSGLCLTAHKNLNSTLRHKADGNEIQNIDEERLKKNVNKVFLNN